MSEFGNSRTWLMRRLFVSAIAALLAVGVVKISVARVVDTNNPTLALSFYGADARALAAQAEALATPEATGTTLSKAAELARSSLRRDGTVAPAIRTLGLVADLNGDRNRAAKLFNFAASTSSRDLPSQLWLIQYAVERDDAAGALNHFDVALRSSHRSANLLFPVLVGATEDNRLLVPIADVLTRRPWWGDGYLVSLVSNGKATDNIVALFERLREKNVAIGAEPRMLLIGRLMRENRFADAFSAYKVLMPAIQAGVLQNGDFEAELRPAFDWILPETPNLRVERISGANGTTSLGFSAERATAGTIARQLLLLKPGSYQISGVATIEQPADRNSVEFNVRCAGTSSQMPTGPDALLQGRATGQAQSFIVPPSNCEAVWIELGVKASDGLASTDGEIDNVKIVRTMK